MIDAISRRFRDGDLKLIQFGASDTTGRIAARLVELAERYGETSERGIRITLPITQEEIGGWTSSSRAGVAQALKTLRDLGWIETDRRSITICELERLRERGPDGLNAPPRHGSDCCSARGPSSAYRAGDRGGQASCSFRRLARLTST